MTDNILKRKEVMKITSLSKTSIYRLMRRGVFPKAVQVTENRVGWRESEINAWLEERFICHSSNPPTWRVNSSSPV